MAVISFGTTPDKIWGGAGWAFRQVLRDLSNVNQLDLELVDTLRQSEHVGSLVVDILDSDLQRRLTDAVIMMCDEILGGRRPTTIDAFHRDAQTQELYRQGLEQLRAAAQASRRRT